MDNTEDLEVFFHLDDPGPYFASYRKIKKRKYPKVNIYLFKVDNPP